MGDEHCSRCIVVFLLFHVVYIWPPPLFASFITPAKQQNTSEKCLFHIIYLFISFLSAPVFFQLNCAARDSSQESTGAAKMVDIK